MRTWKILFLMVFLYVGAKTDALAQTDTDLLKLAEANDSVTNEAVSATFKATRLINGHTVETNGAGSLLFLISHRFGTLNSGAYNFWGLDQATIRLALEYGITNRFTVGLGRSSLEKTYDGYLKYKVLQQKNTGSPVTVTAFTSVAVKTMDWADQEKNFEFAHRLTYSHQLLVARKFSERLSLQVAPTVVHRNLVETGLGETDVYAVGAGGRFKITKRTSFNAEYFYLLPGETADDFKNSLSLGVDIETGGHVFQLMLTNSQGMIEKFFIPRNTGGWSTGDIYFGFNVSRVFNLGKDRREW
ncbi:DUF5777 family beta-barrel protein [Rufibacter tibetensis]|uniref:DUF5777 domain-containing protein n=1 Tax=Rufibacter tibetensis TaxID=512763 RepID=A0A0N7HWT6_9BACT|nr:DUF5777 family beta-barrel protein [Rufibacter tibetensis]ALJ00153.1 hypothetical protein DC20_15740 [Rufibacter tibetensis]